MSRSTATPNSSTRRAAALSSRRAPGVVSVGGQGPREQHPRLERLRTGRRPRSRCGRPPAARRSPPWCRRDGAPDARVRLPPRPPVQGCRAFGPAPPARRRSRPPLARRPPPGTPRRARGAGRRGALERGSPGRPSERLRLRTAARASPCASSKRPRPGWPSSPNAMACGERLLGAVEVAATHPDLHQLAVPPARAVAVDLRAAPRTLAATRCSASAS